MYLYSVFLRIMLETVSLPTMYMMLNEVKFEIINAYILISCDR